MADWKEPNAIQIRVALENVEPVVYRRLVVPLYTTLSELHFILQAAMGWTDSHLHEFGIGGLRYGPPMLNDGIPDDCSRALDSAAVRLRDFDFVLGSGPSFTYLYDLGDCWRHTVTFEKMLSLTPAPRTAICIEGARSCPPEDVGGSDGYFEFLRVLLSPEPGEIEEQKQLRRRCGGSFNPGYFDLDKTDRAVRGALERWRPRL